MGKPDPLCFVAFCSQPQPTALLAIQKLDGPKQVRGSRICYRKSCESRMVTVLSQQPILIGYSLDASVPVTYPAVRLIRSPDDDTQLTRSNNQTQPKSASVARGITYLLWASVSSSVKEPPTHRAWWRFGSTNTGLSGTVSSAKQTSNQ